MTRSDFIRVAFAFGVAEIVIAFGAGAVSYNERPTYTVLRADRAEAVAEAMLTQADVAAKGPAPKHHENVLPFQSGVFAVENEAILGRAQ